MEYLSPFLGMMCEAIRLLSKTLKGTNSNTQSVQPPAQQENSYIRLHPRDVECVCALEMEDAMRASGSESEGPTTETEFDSYANKLCGRFGCSKPFVVLYHMLCISLVIVALASDWISMKGGGSISWELWAFWQHCCLWGLFWQNLLRCYLADADALQRSTLMTVILYTAPLLSEMADTMKDWIVTGICLHASPTYLGLKVGALFIAIDLISRSCIPGTLLAFKEGDISAGPPLIVMAALWTFMELTVSDPVVQFTGYPLFFYLCISMLGPLAAVPLLFVACFILCPFIAPPVLGGVNDGACLFLASTYVIIKAYQVVLRYDESSTAMFNSYCGILALPLYPEERPEPPIGWYSWTRTMVANKMMDCLSSARLLIAVYEDGPQGFIGLALTLGHRGQVGSVGFAAVSACISVLKAVFIPLGQQTILRHTLRRADEGLQDVEAFVWTCLDRIVKVAKLTKSDLVQAWPHAVEKRERDVLRSLNLAHGLTLYQPVYEMTAKWKSENIDIDVGTSGKKLPDLQQSVFDVIFELYRSNEDSVSNFVAKGFSLHDCIAAGFRNEDLIKGGWTEEEVQQARASIAREFPDEELIENHGWTTDEIKKARARILKEDKKKAEEDKERQKKADDEKKEKERTQS